jgi:hypothetical protein
MSPALLAIVLLAGSRSTERFDTVFDAADRVTVVELDVVQEPHGRYGRQVERIIYDSSSAADIEALRGTLRTMPEEGICACIGSTEIHLYRGNERLASIQYLGPLIKGDLWGGDVGLVDHEALLGWFDARGLTGPRKADRERQKHLEEGRQAEARWVAAMPRSLQPLWSAERERIRQEPVLRARPAWRKALAREFPDPVERAGALLTWFGSGEWGTSGSPVHEEIAEQLLLELEPEHLAVAIQETSDIQAAREGAARLVCGRSFSEKHGRLPTALRERLRDHVLSSPDRAQRACAEDQLAP